ncbi:MAG: stalk domain-containing protein [Caldisericia bacterium]
MKQQKNFLTVLLILFMMFSFISLKKTIAQERNIAQIGVIGVMSDDYIGSFTLEWANTVESDFKSDLSYPMQGMKFKNGFLYVLDTSYGRIHILDKNLNHIKVIGEMGYGEGRLQYPVDIDVDDNGNIYVADFFNNYVVKFSNAGDVLLQIGEEGTEDGKFNGPSGIAVSKEGNIYVSDQLNSRIEIFDKEGKFLKSIKSSDLPNPQGLTFDNEGNLWVVEAKNCKIFKLDKDGNVIMSFGGKGAQDSQFIYPFDVEVKGDFIYVVDRGLGTPLNPSIKKFDKSGNFVLKMGSRGTQVPLKPGEFLTPAGIAVDDDENVYTFDAGYFHGPGNPFGWPRTTRLTVFNKNGTFKNKIDYDPMADGRLINPISVSVDTSGNIWVANWANFSDIGEIAIFNSEGKFLKKITGISEDKPFGAIGGVLCGKNEVYVSSGIEGAPIVVFDLQGNFLRVLENCKDTILQPYQMAFDNQGRLWVVSRSFMVYAVSTVDGTIYKEFQIKGEANALAVDNNNNIYVATFDHYVDVYDESGKLLRKIGKGGGRALEKFWFPTGVAVDKDGVIYVGDTENGRIQMFKNDGTFLSSTPRGYYELAHMFIGTDGYIYAADLFHNVVRIISPFGEKLTDYAFSVTSDAIEKISKPGQEVSFNLSLNNKGAKDDVYNISVVSDVYDWKVTYPDKLTVPSKNKTNFEVKVLPPLTAKIGDELKIDLLIKSNGDPTLTKTVSLKVILATRTKILIDKLGVDLDSEFNVNVKVSEVENLYGFGFTFKYDKDYLDLVDIIEGDFLKKDGTSTLFLKNINKEKGEVIVGVSRTGKVSGVNGDGILLSIKFKALKIGKTQLELSEVVLKDPDLNQIKFNSEINEIEILTPDKNPPSLLVTIPSEVKTSSLNISGKVTDESGIKYLRINGKDVQVKSDGTFSYTLTLNEGSNKIVFEAEDTRGNKISKEYYVNYVKKIVLKLQIGNQIMLVNDREQEIDVPPQIIEGRTLLPIRWVAEPLGATVGWDGVEKKVTVTLKSTTIELWIGKNIARVNGVDTPIDPNNPKVVPMIISGRTMLPVRFVAENLGCQVDWDSNTKTVTITYPKD